MADLYVNGTVTGGTSYKDHLFRNTGTRFDDVTSANLRALDADHGALWADLDDDGDVDLALTGGQLTGMHHVFRNLLPAADGRHWLRVRVLDGRRCTTLPDAEVRVFAAGTRRVIAARLVDSGSGYDSQNDLPVHVGLGTADAFDVEVAYPAGGDRKVVLLRNVKPRKLLTVPVK